MRDCAVFVHASVHQRLKDVAGALSTAVSERKETCQHTSTSPFETIDIPIAANLWSVHRVLFLGMTF